MNVDRETAVLYVEDDPDLRDLVPALLERERETLSVSAVGTVSGAVDRFENRRFDCILSDYDLQESDGLALFDRVRTLRPGVPFVLYTGKRDPDIARRARTAGVDKFVQKTCGVGQYTTLAREIETLVERRLGSLVTDEGRVADVPYPVVLFSRDRTVADANDAAIALLQAESRDALAGREMPEFLIPDHRGRALERFETLFTEGEAVPPASFSVETVAGETRDIVVRTVPVTYRGERVAQAVVSVSGHETSDRPQQVAAGTTAVADARGGETSG